MRLPLSRQTSARRWESGMPPPIGADPALQHRLRGKSSRSPMKMAVTRRAVARCESARRGPTRVLRKNRRRIGSSKRGEDNRYIRDFGPRQHRDLLSDRERLDQQEEANTESNDAGPDHRERAKNEDEHHRSHCVMGKLALGYDHTLPFPGSLLAETREQRWLSYS